MALNSDDKLKETLAILKILERGNRQILEGRVRPAADVIKRLRKSK